MFKNIIKGIKEGIGIIDENDILLYCNSTYADIYEESPENLIGKSVMDWDDASTSDLVKQQRSETIKGVFFFL